MSLLGQTIAVAARRARWHAQNMLQGIAPGQFATKPRGPGGVIEMNHPAFIYGHLGLYPPRILGLLGADSAVTVPPEWSALFQPGATCQDDPDGRIYPAMDQITNLFFQGLDAAIVEVERQPDSVFERIMPDERYRQFLPTIGAAALSMLNNHVSFHIGQVSAWRRFMGLGSAT